MLNVALFCGGSGSSSLVRELSIRSNEIKTTLIINPYDDGKSTGKLREAIPGLPGISDFRKNIVNASPLARSGELNQRVDDFAVGNGLIASLFLSGMTFQDSIDTAADIFKVPLRILSVTDDPVSLSATLSNGDTLHDEASIVSYEGQHRISDLHLSGPVMVNKEAVEAVNRADIVIYGAGTQHSSLLPTYLTLSRYGGLDVSSISAKRVLVANLEYEGDTRGWSTKDLVDSAQKYWQTDSPVVDRLLLDKSSSFVNDKYEYVDCIDTNSYRKHDGKKLLDLILGI